MAVYTEVADAALREFLEEYDLGALVSVIGVAEGVENTNYLLIAERGRFILTLYEKRVRRRDLPFFLGLMRHLSARGVPCPTPVAARDGEALRELANRPAAVFSFLEGVWPRRVWPEHCRALGGALADLHLAGRDYPARRANDLSAPAFRALFAASANRADTVAPGLARALEEEIAALESAWPDGLPRGIVHADLFPDNAFFRSDAVSGIIDFYFACDDSLAWDLAICLNAWCFEADGEFNVTKARRLLAAYRERRALAPEELEALPLLCRGAAARFLLTRLHDWLRAPRHAFSAPKDPLEYWRKLRFHRSARGAAAYGLDRA